MEQNNKEYKNKDITVSWKPRQCVHATICYKELIEVFNPGRRPWVNMEGAPTEKIIEVVDKCPTQALSWRWNKPEEKNNKQAFEKETTPQAETIIQVVKDGPLLIQGEFKIINQNGIELKKMAMTSLCRCGKTQKMPFCDGSHRKK